MPEIPDLDLMALLPPELRQPVAPAHRHRAQDPSPPGPLGDPAAAWAAEATSFAFAQPGTAPAEAPPNDPPDPGPAPPSAAARSGLSDFLADGLRHLDQPAPRALTDASPPAHPGTDPAPAGPAPVGFAAFLADGLRHLDAPAPREPSPPPAPLGPPEPPPISPAPVRSARPAPPPGWSLPPNPSLAGAREIAGLVAVCLVDAEDGLLLAAEGRGLDFEAVAAHSTEVVRAERRTIELLGLADDLEDILVTTGRRLHVLRPLRALPTCFLHLILDRKAANLGMARFQLDRIEGGLGP